MLNKNAWKGLVTGIFVALIIGLTILPVLAVERSYLSLVKDVGQRLSNPNVNVTQGKQVAHKVVSPRSFDGPPPYIVPAAAFQDDGLDDDYYFWFSGGYIGGQSSTVCLRAPVYLPDQVTIQNFRLYAYDNSVPLDFTVHMRRKKYDVIDSAETVASVMTTGAVHEIQVIETTSINFALVDNQNYTYYVSTCFASGSDLHRITAVEIDYKFAIADFSANLTSGPAPLTVTFANLTVGRYESCLWNFGDGNSSTNCAPNHIYSNAGVYPVTLTVEGYGTSDTFVRSGYITVYQPAVANFSGTPLRGVEPLDVAFTNLSSGDYSSCSWDFGDGDTTTDCNTSHLYSAVGSYTVSLTVSGLGGNNTETKADYIVVEPDKIYLPITLNNYCAGFPGPWEVEPNDSAAQANGPLCSGRDYLGNSDDNGSAFDSDYFYVDVAKSGTIVVKVTDFLTNLAQVQLYAHPVSGDTLLVNVVDQPLGEYNISYPVSPGRYYIRVVASDGHQTGTGPYTLRVTFP